jgi:hypothetical protein
MCTVSMVHDAYSKQFEGLGWPTLNDWPPYNQTIDLEGLRQLIADFKQCVEAAKIVDRLTKQPDCVDPEKAKLQEQVARLEAVIDRLLNREETRMVPPAKLVTP